MWVVNNDKERVKTYLRSDIESNITNLCDVSSRVHDSIVAISNAIANSPSGSDRRITDECKRALKEIEEGLHNLYSCRNYVEQLETREWVDDE